MEIIEFDNVYRDDLKHLGQWLRNYIVSLENRDDDLIIYNTDTEIAEYIKEFFSSQNIIFLIKNEWKIQGYIIGKIKTENWNWSQIKKIGQVEQLFIASELRGKWAWKKLIERCETHFLEKWISHIEVSVFAKNKNAFDFYKKYGFDERFITLDKKIIPKQGGE